MEGREVAAEDFRNLKAATSKDLQSYVMARVYSKRKKEKR